MAGAWEVGKEQNIEFQPDTSDLDSNIPERKNLQQFKASLLFIISSLEKLELGLQGKTLDKEENSLGCRTNF